MAFNLNKNDGAAAPSKKPGFSLEENSSDLTQQESHKESYWIPVVFVLILIGGAAWYFMNQNNSATPGANGVVAESATGESDMAGGTTAIRLADDKPLSGAGKVSSDEVNALRIDGDPEAVLTTTAGAEKKDGSISQAASVVAASFKAGAIEPKEMDNGRLAEIRKKMKNGKAVKVIVQGYASSEGGLANNQAISQARADAYKKILVRNGVPEAKIIAEGRGIENPVASNEKESGRRKNRRVEILYQ